MFLHQKLHEAESLNLYFEDTECTKHRIHDQDHHVVTTYSSHYKMFNIQS